MLAMFVFFMIGIFTHHWFLAFIVAMGVLILG